MDTCANIYEIPLNKFQRDHFHNNRTDEQPENIMTLAMAVTGVVALILHHNIALQKMVIKLFPRLFSLIFNTPVVYCNFGYPFRFVFSLCKNNSDKLQTGGTTSL